MYSVTNPTQLPSIDAAVPAVHTLYRTVERLPLSPSCEYFLQLYANNLNFCVAFRNIKHFMNIRVSMKKTKT